LPLAHFSEILGKLNVLHDGAFLLKQLLRERHRVLGSFPGQMPIGGLAERKLCPFDPERGGGRRHWFVVGEVKYFSDEVQVGNTASKKTERVEGRGGEDEPFARDGAPGGLEPHDAVERGGTDDGAGGLGAEGEGGLVVGDCGGGAGGGAAGGASEVVGWELREERSVFSGDGWEVRRGERRTVGAWSSYVYRSEFCCVCLACEWPDIVRRGKSDTVIVYERT
jgi:hypothetical protein